LSETWQPGDPERFREAVERIDDDHRRDPNGRALEHALAVVAWVTTLRPQASEALRLAGRAQHIGRWRVPRETYPRNRTGYLRWRADLQLSHVAEAAGILAACGYPQPFIDRVGSIMRKERLQDDPETQALEDALCLVFIEHQLAGFQEQHGGAKVQRILRRTWVKMSPAGREAALGLSLAGPVRALLARSLAGSGDV
jgi:hypothetical protein